MPMMTSVASELKGAGVELSLLEFGLSLSIALSLLFRAWRRVKNLVVTFGEGEDDTSSSDSASKDDPFLVSGLSLLLWLGEEVLEKLFGAPIREYLEAHLLDFDGYEEGLLKDGVGDLVEEAEKEDGDFWGEEALKGVGEGDLSVANTLTIAMKTSATTTRPW
ncbi:hypothetical protein GOBAR_DD06137 [Gossypium barbadense]|nr:hypothetical protein GOBAR_DD06137 [Gossypium barbadense]